MLKRKIATIALVALIGGGNAGCSTAMIDNNPNPISAALGLSAPLKQVVTQDAQDAEANLTQAQAIGVLPLGDPAPACIHSVNVQLGVDVDPNAPPLQSFTAKTSGLMSLGSVAYIGVEKLDALQANGITVAPECLQILGKLQLGTLVKGMSLGVVAIHVSPPAPVPLAKP